MNKHIIVVITIIMTEPAVEQVVVVFALEAVVGVSWRGKRDVERRVVVGGWERVLVCRRCVDVGVWEEARLPGCDPRIVGIEC